MNIVGTTVLAAALVIAVIIWTFVALDTRLNRIERRLPQTTTTTMVARHG